jgi:hypothetical protein
MDDSYICGDRLPKRPNGDKEFLSAMVEGEYISEKALDMLPPSIVAKIDKPTIGITIDEIATITDILIVIRSDEVCRGKKFRLDNFKLLIQSDRIEIYKKVNNG